MFWVGVIISLGALLGIPPWQNWIKSRLPQVTDRALGITRSLFILGGIVISVASHYQSAQEKEALRSSLQTTKDSLHNSQQEVNELKERELLRPWAMVTYTGKTAKDRMGRQSESGGRMEERHKKIFGEDDFTFAFSILRCSENERIEEIKSLIRDYPKLPYAYVALTYCLKQRGDPSWESEGKQAKELLEKLIVIHPHVTSMDSFYGMLTIYLFGKDIESTGHFQLGEDGMYRSKPYWQR